MAQPAASDLNNIREDTLPRAQPRTRAPLIRRTDREWLSLFIEFENENCRLVDFCKPRGMSPTSFSTKRTRLLKRYCIGIRELSSLDLNSIDFNDFSDKAFSNVNLLNATNELLESDISHSLNPKIEDKPGSVVDIVFKAYTVRVPMSHDPAWVSELVQRLLKIDLEMRS